MKDIIATSEIRIEPITFVPFFSEAWVCLCGNTPSYEGFYPCDEQGNVIEPIFGNAWQNLYVCFACGRIINHYTLEVVGQNAEVMTIPAI